MTDVADSPPLLALEGIGHAYLGRVILSNINLTVAAGEILALLGPSGCGKSTLAHIAAGLTDPLQGTVHRRYRRHSMVFQEPHLLPWATARRNIEYPLRIARMNKAERCKRVEAAVLRAALVPSDLDKYPAELSGGMRQRTAIARALAVEPDFVYFDEPFTALDAALKRHMQDLMIAAACDAHFGALFITHDLFEAARIAHRVVVMDPQGNGIVGEKTIPGQPGKRDDAMLYRLMAGFMREDTLFRHIHNIDERQQR